MRQWFLLFLCFITFQQIQAKIDSDLMDEEEEQPQSKRRSIPNNRNVKITTVKLDQNHPAKEGYKPKSGGDMQMNENTDDYWGGTRSGVSSLEQLFGFPFEWILSKLPRQGTAAQPPWPSSYWPTIRDGINYRHGGPGTQTAPEKYATAFGKDPTAIIHGVSEVSGVLEYIQEPRQQCTSDAECQGTAEESMCAMQEGAQSGICLPIWYGSCSAWAPAAILEPEPRCPIVYNNVQFTIMDIKALITLIYEGSSVETVFLGSRCNDPVPEKDLFGRNKELHCRDMTPDLFHLLLTNTMGLHGKSFIVDKDANGAVWNQPALNFQVQQLQYVNSHEAAQLVSPMATQYVFNPNAVRFAYVVTDFSYVTEGLLDQPLSTPDMIPHFATPKQYHYILELDANDRIIGGEWVGPSHDDHWDFAWFPKAKPGMNVEVAGIRYADVQTLLQMSQQC